ncbi:MAG: hypothetical protein KAS32_12095 [Candidatus Peribacteraceae bacterium]|nr:hypothetical protein [Candidatus Peribacteraceae bacterium]
MDEPNVALFDMDGTLVDYDKGMFGALKAVISDEEFKNLPADIHNDLPDWLFRLKQLIYNQPGWWLNLERLRTGFQILDIAREIGFEIMILTKGPRSSPNSWKEKVEWCKLHVPDAKITITEDKSLVYGKVLVDDFPDYVLPWLKHRPRGIAIMPDHSYNSGFCHNRVLRTDGNNIETVRDILQKVKDRPQGEDFTSVGCVIL